MSFFGVRGAAILVVLCGPVVAGGVWVRLEARQATAGHAVAAAPHRTVIGDYCLDCHDNNARVAGLSLESLLADDVVQHADVWEAVIRKLRTRQMPPVGEFRPDDATYDAVVSYLEKTLDAD